MKTLHDLGWNEQFEQAFAPYRDQGWEPARLIRDNKITLGALTVCEGKFEELEVVTSGKVYHEALTDAELPAVGDWVALEAGGDNGETVIRARLPRQTCFSRKVPGNSSEEQVLAANVDFVVIVTDAVIDFNPRRLERYFAVIGRSGAKPVVLINKADLYSDEENEAAVATIRELCADAGIHITTALKKTGVKVVREYLQPGKTAAFIGSSGVGKSALINQLLGGEYQWTGEVNEVTGKGRHTTTARELMVLRSGGIVIDNPGIKEVQLWTDEKILRERFADISAIALHCKYHDCKHGTDAGCAIRAAIQAGTLDASRFDGFLKLEEEIEELRRRQKKRQMTLERITKREHRIKARNRDDRRRIEREQRDIRAHELEDE